MDRCERAGIPTDYETLALSIIELYVDQYIPDILHYHNYERITYIEKTLDYWKERGYIESYTEYYKGDKTYAEGVEITPAENRNLIPQRGRD